MAEHIEIDKDDARFVEAVGAVLEKRIPHVVQVERFLSTTVLVVTALSAFGLLALAAWAGRVVWQKDQEEYIKATIRKVEEDPTGPVGSLSTSFNNMSKTLGSTFESQVDSATFKVLRFGCTPPNAQGVAGFPACASTAAAAGMFQSADDQTILFVANPATQVVRLDISVYAIGDNERLIPLLLQVYAEPPAVRATSNSARKTVCLRPEQLGSGSGELLQDGRLRLVISSGVIQQASIDLTPSLKELKLSGPIQLRFAAVKEDPTSRSESACSGDGSKVYGPATGTELFFVRTITSAYHRIPAIQTEAKK
jgi:hypothetical protein